MSNVHDPHNIGRWPALLTLELACRYLSLEKAQFFAVAEKWKVAPVEIEGINPLWRQKDLNRMIDRLPVLPEFPSECLSATRCNLDQAAIARLALAIAGKLQESGLPSIETGPALLSIKETARQLGVGRSTVYKRINDGTLNIRRVGGRTLVTRESINALLKG